MLDGSALGWTMDIQFAGVRKAPKADGSLGKGEERGHVWELAVFGTRPIVGAGRCREVQFAGVRKVPKAHGSLGRKSR